MEPLLTRTWHWIADELPAAVTPVDLLPGSLNEPLLITRDASDQLHCVSNVCTHRAAVLVDAPQDGSVITCPYHGRRFDLTGACRGQPFCKGLHRDPAAHLPRAQWGRLGPMLFATLGDQPFEAFTQALTARVLPYSVTDLQPDAAAHRDYVVDAHWTLYVENYLEGLHIPFVHPALDAALDAKHYGVECLPGAVLQVGTAEPDAACLPLPTGHIDAERRIFAYYLWLFPTTMINVYPWGISLNAVQPLGPNRCRVRFRSYVRPQHRIPPGFAQDLHQTEMEDEAVVQRVQRGMQARLARPGALVRGHEDGVAWFRRLLAEAS